MFSKTCTLFVADPATGTILWRYKTEPILGNIVESEGAVFFSIKDRIIALDIKNGAELYKEKLPWEEEFSPHKVLLRGHSVIVGNEWNVAMWDQKDGKLVYHHHFEPLCPIMTTEERMREQKALGGQASAMTAGAFSSIHGKL
ncbi:MAG: PQQ-binding-like beta-propeller repeat protein [Deltaproteobacteria bacterium]|nr:PQQ-binding-like beta-propeller repeat protein [Deltaproteobacteria bacterium]